MGVATHRAASFSEPYFEIASWSSCSWYSGERQPLSTKKLDPVVRGISCSLAQGTEESWIKVGYTRNLVVKDRRAVGDGTVSLAEPVLAAKDDTVSLATRTTELTAKDVDG